MIKVYKKINLKSPYLVASWPGMGEVALKAAFYLKTQLKAVGFARLRGEEFYQPTGSLIKEGLIYMPPLPQGEFYFWKDKKSSLELIIFLSDAQPNLEKGYLYSKIIIDFVKKYRVRKVFSFAAMPLPIEHTQKPRVWIAATHKELLRNLERHGLKPMSSGQISGLNGLFLGVAKKEGLEGMCLLGEIPLYTIQIENPKASLAVLEVFCKIINLDLDLSYLQEQAKSMDSEIEKLIDYLKASGQPESIGEEEIERIKKSLSIYTKLPESAKKNIERLFEEAKKDISKAYELKQELDKWDVYKEYEDRFLDLFKKKRKDN